MKCQVKKSLAKEKVERFRTGGGSCVTDVDDKLLKMLGNRAVPIPLINTYDSDADYHKASGITHWFYLFISYLFHLWMNVIGECLVVRWDDTIFTCARSGAGIVTAAVCLCICLSVCVSVRWITPERIDGSQPNLVGRGRGWTARGSSDLVLIRCRMRMQDHFSIFRNCGAQVCCLFGHSLIHFVVATFWRWWDTTSFCT